MKKYRRQIVEGYIDHLKIQAPKRDALIIVEISGIILRTSELLNYFFLIVFIRFFISLLRWITYSMKGKAANENFSRIRKEKVTNKFDDTHKNLFIKTEFTVLQIIHNLSEIFISCSQYKLSYSPVCLSVSVARVCETKVCYKLLG